MSKKELDDRAEMMKELVNLFLCGMAGGILALTFGGDPYLGAAFGTAVGLRMREMP